MKTLKRLVGAVCLCAAGAPAQTKDTVRLADGNTETGQVKSEEFAGLSLTLANGKTDTYPWAQVAGVQYGGAPEFAKAAMAFAQGSLTDALPQLETLASNPKLRPVLRQQVLFYQAQGLQRTGKPAEAIATYNTLLQEFPKTRFMAGVADGLYSCHVAKSDIDGGRAALDALASGAKSAGADRGVLGSIELRKARLLEAQKKNAEERAAYDASQGQGVPAEIAAEARLGIGRCRQAEGQTAEAERTYRELIGDKGSPRNVLAGAWNGIGDLLREDGKKARSTDRLLEALFAHLRGVVQYAPAPGDPTDEHERALAGATLCFRFISELEQDPEKRKLNADRAKERKSELERRFPGSTYLQGL